RAPQAAEGPSARNRLHPWDAGSRDRLLTRPAALSAAPGGRARLRPVRTDLLGRHVRADGRAADRDRRRARARGACDLQRTGQLRAGAERDVRPDRNRRVVRELGSLPARLAERVWRGLPLLRLVRTDRAALAVRRADARAARGSG